MVFALHKKLLLVMVLWFAMLQTVAPFIHAHIETDSPTQGHGLHVHDQDFVQIAGGIHTFKTLNAHPVHTIGVNDAVVKNADLLPLPLFALLFVIFLPAAVARLAENHSIPFPFSKLHLRSLFRPRAPPLF